MLEYFGGIATLDPDRGREPEEDAGSGSDQRDVEQHRGVDAERLEAQEAGRLQRGEGMRARPTECQTDQRAERR